MKKFIILITLFLLSIPCAHAMERELLLRERKDTRTRHTSINTLSLEEHLLCFESQTEEEKKKERQKAIRSCCFKTVAITLFGGVCCTTGALFVILANFLFRKQ